MKKPFKKGASSAENTNSKNLINYKELERNVLYEVAKELKSKDNKTKEKTN